MLNWTAIWTIMQIWLVPFTIHFPVVGFGTGVGGALVVGIDGVVVVIGVVVSGGASEVVEVVEGVVGVGVVELGVVVVCVVEVGGVEVGGAVVGSAVDELLAAVVDGIRVFSWSAALLGIVVNGAVVDASVTVLLGFVLLALVGLVIGFTVGLFFEGSVICSELDLRLSEPSVAFVSELIAPFAAVKKKQIM